MRSNTTISIDRADREHLAQFAKEAGLTLGEMVHRLVKREEERRFWKEADKAYKRLREDKQAWAEYQAENDLFERASLQDLKDHGEPW